MTLRDVRVRRRLHELDRTRSSYPTVARTGDLNRRGKFPLVFDDTNTVVFNQGTQVSFPTTLAVGSKYLSSDLTSSIATSVSGSVVPSAIDQWLARSYEAEAFQAFKEDNLHEQLTHVISSSYYQTGSALIDVGDGFTSSLMSKTVIRLELPLTGVSLIDPLSASNLYYDFRTQKFEQVFVNGTRTFGTNDYDIVNAGNQARPPMPGENPFFNCLGKHSTNLQTTGFQVTTPPDAFPNFFFESSFGDNFNASWTNAAVTQTLSMDGIINQPFLLEKCVVKLPFLAGPGWFKEKTRMQWTNWGVASPVWAIDLGGPALTFALFNQLSNTNQKELVLSATVIPERDNIRQWQVVNSFYLKLAGQTTPYATSSMPQGFKSFSLPTVVVPEPTNQLFTGSITFETEPFVSIGTTMMQSFESVPNVGLPTARNVPFVQCTVGRSKNSNVTDLVGRSIFGRTANVPSLGDLQYVNLDLYVASGTGTDVEKFLQVEKHTRSPYLLNPKDKLVFSISKMRGAFISESYDSSGPDTTYVGKGYPPPSLLIGDANVWLYQSSSHDVAINSGTMSITLYGSLIREGKETHDTLNSRLDTDQVHEAIGSELITDEFEVAYSGELSGTMQNRFKLFSSVPYVSKGNTFLDTSTSTTPGLAITGSGFSETVFDNYSTDLPFVQNVTTGATGSWSSKLKYLMTRHVSEVRKSCRNTVLIGNELFWDSRLPDPKQATMIANPSMSLAGAVPTDSMTYYRVMYSGPSGLLGNSSNVGIGDWIMTYPYEAKYSGISYKFFDNLNGDTFTWVDPTDLHSISTPTYFRYENINMEVGDTGFRKIAGETPVFGSPNSVVGLGYSEFVKVFYGTGDGRGKYDNRHVTFRRLVNYLSSSASNWVGANLRGWRHGMISGFPLYSMAVYRRNRYGQLRDMLEQRIDGKFYSEGGVGTIAGALDGPVQVKFVDSSGNVVKPYETFSSNLSFEATSSVPYTDGTVRNREDPIGLANINQSVVVL